MKKLPAMKPTEEPRPFLPRPWVHTLVWLLIGVAAGSLLSAVCSPYTYARISSRVSVDCYQSVVLPRQQPAPEVPPRPELHQQADIAEQYIPAALKQMLVCITFHWNAGKLVYLTTVLQTLATHR